MKTISRKLIFLAIAGITLAAAIGVQSCKKSSSSPAGPAVTSVTSGASDTVGKSYTLTITGTNLTGATVSTTATGVTITGVSATATTISGTIAIGSTATPGSVTLTITTTAGTTTTTITVVPIPLIGGYASSDSVASANLIAYWPFDGDANDHKGGLTATTAGSITYTSTGVRGQAYQGATGAYATLTPAATFPTQLTSYTVSFWYNLPTLPKSGTQGVFFYSGSTQQGELINEIESYSPVSGDSVRIHPGFWDIGDAPNYELFVPETFDTAAVGKWVFFTVSYNGGTSTYTTYQNGVPTGANEAFTSGKYVTPNPLFTDGTMATPLGNLGFTDPVGTITIGSWPDGLFGQASATANFLGQLDELRVYNKALTQQEVAGLFLNGQAGR
jgi:hypothetical protein